MTARTEATPFHFICAWCQAVLGPSPTGEDSHGICLSCLPGVFDVPVATLDALSADEADALPYGLIRIDDADRVIAFNRAEARLAKLPKERVIGRSFFAEVAPCTNVKELAGWIRDARRSGRSQRTEITFVFDFAHGRRLVSIAMTYNARLHHATLLVRPQQEAA